MKTRLIAPVIMLALVASGCAAEDGAIADSATTPAAVELVDAPDVAGQGLGDARATLEDLGYTVTVHDSLESRAILMESNWVVTDQTVAGDTIALGAKKPDDKTAAEKAAEEAAAAAQAEADAAAQAAADAATSEPVELSAEDERALQLLALQMTLVDSPEKQLLCDSYATLGPDLTASVINSELPAGSEFPADVVQEVFDANC